MTRLEALFKKIDEAYDEKGDFFFDPIQYVKEYLAERDQRMAEEIIKLSANKSQTFRDIAEADAIYVENMGPLIDDEQIEDVAQAAE